MGRKRYITSDMTYDAKVARVAAESGVAGLMWPWFLLSLDDWARTVGDPWEIKYGVFQIFAYEPDDIQKAITLYDKYGLIHRYAYGDKTYVQANPVAFYKLNSYIQKSRQQHDASKLPPPRDHPWGMHWKTSDWDDNGQHISATDNEE